MDLLLRLADFSVKAAAMPPSSILGDRLAGTYQTWAAKNYGMSSGHCLRHPIMVRELKPAFDRISSSFLAMGPVACNLHLDSLIGAVIRNKPRPAHPLKHLTLMACMYQQWDEFWSCYTGDFSLPLGSRKTALVPKKRSQEPSPLDQFVQLVQASNFGIQHAASAVGVSKSTGFRWAKAKGLHYSSRARKLTPDLVDQVCQILRRGYEKTEVLSRTKISSASLNSLLASEPNLRAQWRCARLERHRRANRQRFLTVQQEHPELPLWRLRKLPNTGWAWLYRHDKEWLTTAKRSLEDGEC
ncbi:TnsD family Tn7-like transposition protein [Comamonas testosteroni]|uniref:TnsD family Tn7-like transposition protein n=1 Tax=Comamonas testosteroni TaxID=285 RepID=UPI003918970C